MPTDVQSVTSVIPACGEDHTASPRDHLAAALHRLEAATDMVCDVASTDAEIAPAWVGSVLCLLIEDIENAITEADIGNQDELTLRGNDKPLGGLLAGVMDLAQRAEREDDLGGLSRREALLAAHVLTAATEQLGAYLANFTNRAKVLA